MIREPRIFQTIFTPEVNCRLQRLISEPDHPIVALRIRHPAWIVAHGNLARFSISAAQKMTRRGFDNLFFPHLVAVGLFKVLIDPRNYKIELHLIVAGARTLSRLYTTKFFRTSWYVEKRKLCVARLPLTGGDLQHLLAFLGRYAIGARLVLNGLRWDRKLLVRQECVGISKIVPGCLPKV
jgi:hypothetical protein